ncbi:hypothetical protein Tco_1167913 [Tanacetum coccineum]
MYPSQRFLLEVARGPTLKASDGVGICPLGSLVIVVAVVVVIVVVAVVVVIVVTVVVVVVIVVTVVVFIVCSCRLAPTVPSQVANLLAVTARWYTSTVMVEVTLGT